MGSRELHISAASSNPAGFPLAGLFSLAVRCFGFRRPFDIVAGLALEFFVVLFAIPAIRNRDGARRHGGDQAVLLDSRPVLVIQQIDALEPDAGETHWTVHSSWPSPSPRPRSLASRPPKRRRAGRCSALTDRSTRVAKKTPHPRVPGPEDLCYSEHPRIQHGHVVLRIVERRAPVQELLYAGCSARVGSGTLPVRCRGQGSAQVHRGPDLGPRINTCRAMFLEALAAPQFRRVKVEAGGAHSPAPTARPRVRPRRVRPRPTMNDSRRRLPPGGDELTPIRK